MIKYIIKRIIAMLITLFIIVSLCFLTIRMIPGDIVGQGAQPEIREAMEARYHLNDPLPEQYVTFLRNFFTLDFGESITTYPRRPVFDIILEKIPLTLQLNLLSLVITIPLGILFGILAALKRTSPRTTPSPLWWCCACRCRPLSSRRCCNMSFPSSSAGSRCCRNWRRQA